MFKNAQFNVFKGKSACRLSFIGQQQDFTPGFLFLELAEVKGKNGNNNRTYDWENKIGIKLSGVDISKLAYAIERGDSGELFHEFNGTTKIISIKRADSGQSPYFLSVMQKGKDDNKSISVPLSSEETYSFLTLLKYSIPKILGW